ncbi:helix-turn-helix transcriptional regulator [Phenylobacterium sp.]|uniref:helix-turn-helix transcriptional regulator n=1 Tax=Phenylobacterium sp. TaxID=1871053 RepID=UPI0037C61296
MISDKTLPAFGARLRRLRRLRGWKQSQVAEFANVSQTTVSRWEVGEIEPDAWLMAKVLYWVGSSSGHDSALRRLVQSSRHPVHLIGEADHRLLSASEPRVREWRRSAGELLGSSLWRFATDEIVEAEKALIDRGWWAQADPAPVLVTTRNYDGPELRIVAGTMTWERVYLGDGTPARLCTSAGA